MRRGPSETGAWAVGAALGGAMLLGGAFLTLAAWPRSSKRTKGDSWQTAPTFTEADVEAAARMLASENPHGSEALHIEQVHTQLRSRKAGQSLFARITAGSGWGPQGGSRPGGGVPPVSTVAAATPGLRQLAREVLAGLHPSKFRGARQFFEPAIQDRARTVGIRARREQAEGLPLTHEEQRLLGYRRSAEQVRTKWRAKRAKYLGTLDGIEFFLSDPFPVNGGDAGDREEG